MLLINLIINFFDVLKINSLECISIINQESMKQDK